MRDSRFTDVAGAASAAGAERVESNQWTKYSSRQAHGFAAEDFNALIDKLNGKEVDKVGLSNELNGADRIVDGVKIQSKYCKSAYDSVANAFGEDGLYRYPDMKLEVPKGQGADAVRYMEQRIADGKVPGVTDPSAAGEIVVEGSCTYKQATEFAKAGNFESLKFDAVNQSVTCAYVMGLSFVISYVLSRSSGSSMEDAFKHSAQAAAKNGVLAMGAGVAVQQFLRTQIGRNATAVVTKSVKKGVDAVMKTEAGRKVVEKTMSGVLGKSVAQGTARNAAVGALRSNVFVSFAFFVATTVPDVVKACRGKERWGEVGENATVNAAGIGAGSAGWWAGAAAGSCICPGIGTVIGGLIGSIGAGAAATAGVRKLFRKS